VTKILLPLTFVLIAVTPNVHSITLCLVVVPLSYVRFALNALPDAVTLLDALYPFTIIEFSVDPRIHTFTMSLALDVLPLVKVSGRPYFVTMAVSLILLPLTLVDSASIVVDENTKALPLLGLRVKLAPVNRVSILLDSKRVRDANLLIIKLIADHLILLNRVTVVFKLIALARRSETCFRHLLLDNLYSFMKISLHSLLHL